MGCFPLQVFWALSTKSRPKADQDYVFSLVWEHREFLQEGLESVIAERSCAKLVNMRYYCNDSMYAAIKPHFLLLQQSEHVLIPLASQPPPCKTGEGIRTFETPPVW